MMKLRAGAVRARAGIVRAWTFLFGAFDRSDVLTVIGLGLIAGGLWDVSRAAALGVPGAILVWMALPPRPPFVGKR